MGRCSLRHTGRRGRSSELLELLAACLEHRVSAEIALGTWLGARQAR